MHNGLATEGYEDSLIVQAHEYFQLQTRDWIGSDDESDRARMEALETAVTGMLRMVVIDLSPKDDPHVIFETLNARGTPLLESDLIKNYVTARASKDRPDVVWGDLDHNWWREEYRQGRLLRPRIDALLDYWLEMYTSDEVSAGKIFSVFRKLTAKRDVEDIMSKVKADLSNYRRYEEGPRSPAEEVFHYRTGVMQMAAFTPALLTILSKPEGVRMGTLRALESFLIRRMMCRSTTKDYNRLALDLVRELSKRSSEQADREVVEFLAGQEAESRRWPTDADLENALCTLPLYRLLTRGRLRLVLEGIEEHYRRNHFAEQTEVPKGLTIEHVLPQSWEANWPLPQDQDEQDARQRRNTLAHTIGNLTLITGRLNSTVSNAPWEEKRRTLGEHSILLMNRILLADYGDAPWNEENVVARSKKMAMLVANVWPGPNVPLWESME